MGRLHDSGQERRVTRVEDVLAFHAKLLDKVIFLFLGRDGREDLGAFEMGDLDGSDADAAGARVDQYGFAALEIGAVGESVDCCCEYKGEGRDNLSGRVLAWSIMI